MANNDFLDGAGDGTSDNPCSDTYCGDSVFSESESRAIRDAVLAANGRISYYFSFHSYGLLWTFPYSYTASHASNYEEMVSLCNSSENVMIFPHRRYSRSAALRRCFDGF